MPRQRNTAPPAGTFTLNTASPQARGLIAWYPTIGGQSRLTLRDFSGIGPALAPTNAPTIVGDSERGFAAQFIGASTQSFASALLPVQSPPFSFAAWIFLTGVTQSGFALAVTDTARTTYHALLIQAASISAYSRKSGSYNVAATGGTITTGRWHHAVGVWETASLRRLYLNGVLVSTDSNTASGMPTLDSFCVGSGTSGLGALDAKITDARVYNRIIGPNEAYNIYAKPWDLYKTVKRPIRGWKPMTLSAATRNRRTILTPPAGWLGVRRQSSQAQGLVSWLPFMGAGRFRDFAGPLSLTASGTPTIENSVTHGQAASFNGSSRLADTSHTPAITGYPFSVALRVNVTAAAGAPYFSGTIFNWANAAAPSFTNYITAYTSATNQHTFVVVNGANVGVVRTPTALTTGAWYDLLWVAPNSTDTNWLLYINGIESGTGRAGHTVSFPSGLSRIAIGQEDDGTYGSNIKIADLRFYNRAIGPSEAIAIWKNRRWDLYDTLMSRRKTMPLIGTAAAIGSRFRRTFSHLGTRTGTRQIFD